MTKEQQKAKGIVSKALGTFYKAIEEVKKANSILETGALRDEVKMEETSLEITDLYTELDVYQADKINKEAEIIQNKELIAKLERFTR